MKEKSFSVPSSERLSVTAITASRVASTSRSAAGVSMPRPRKTRARASGTLLARCFTSRPGRMTGRRECSLIRRMRRWWPIETGRAYQSPRSVVVGSVTGLGAPMRASSFLVQRMATMRAAASGSLLQGLLAQVVDRSQTPRRGVAILPEGPAVGRRIGAAGRRPDHRLARHPAGHGEGVVALFGEAHAPVGLDHRLEAHALVLLLERQRWLHKACVDQVLQLGRIAHGRLRGL